MPIEFRRILCVTWLALTFSVAFTVVARAEETLPLDAKDKLIVETVLRLKSFDLDASAPAKAAVLRYLHARAGTDQYFALIERFKPVEIAEQLAEFSIAHADTTAGVRAAEALFAMDQQHRLTAMFESPETQRALVAIELVGRAGGSQTGDLLFPLLTSETTPLAQRIAAVAAVGRQINGQKKILELVKKSNLPEEMTFAAANVLLASRDASIAEEAAKYVSLPATADSQPLPPIAELSARRGNVGAGKLIFTNQGTCINCHRVDGEGKEVGPDLSDIGSKLSREAMYVAILDPNAAISHNYETYAALTADGTLETGLLISKTDQQIVIRTNEGIDKTIDSEEIELFEKKATSMMPQNLQQLMTVDQLVDLVEYTLSLKTRPSSPAEEL